ncbi:nli interacting factor-like phosphatase family protein [Stylonychia lemnae]|uniref:Nli interacting factor-like phosphatase family protein n=1 Tax=Stylonychia lemnae TaxID=5949 RepID=A0A078AEH2_STYLE|nr:nli interacting factor-like phosphatase family protein [Stylonychia lemnae]|eukprot:CDW80669.1 nli interacting factor-like phosphatase family protein [Stylonychia lemnae]
MKTHGQQLASNDPSHNYTNVQQFSRDTVLLQNLTSSSIQNVFRGIAEVKKQQDRPKFLIQKQVLNQKQSPTSLFSPNTNLKGDKQQVFDYNQTSTLSPSPKQLKNQISLLRPRIKTRDHEDINKNKMRSSKKYLNSRGGDCDSKQRIMNNLNQSCDLSTSDFSQELHQVPGQFIYQAPKQYMRRVDVAIGPLTSNCTSLIKSFKENDSMNLLHQSFELREKDTHTFNKKLDRFHLKLKIQDKFVMNTLLKDSVIFKSQKHHKLDQQNHLNQNHFEEAKLLQESNWQINDDLSNSAQNIFNSVSVETCDDNQGDDSQMSIDKLEINDGQRQHLMDSLKSFYLINQYRHHLNYQTKNRILRPDVNQIKVNIPTPKNFALKKLLILDMDETLIHAAASSEIENYPVKPNIITQFDDPDDNRLEIAIFFRPYLHTFLKNMAKYFQIVIFTASDQNYADCILNIVDPERLYIDMRMYRPFCKSTDFGYIKDLSIIQNRNLENVVIVDNNLFCCALQINNAIPIQPFYCDPKDEELNYLEQYLMNKVLLAKDVRLCNSVAFDLENVIKVANQELFESLDGPLTTIDCENEQMSDQD